MSNFNHDNVWIESLRFAGSCARCGQSESKHFTEKKYCFEPPAPTEKMSDEEFFEAPSPLDKSRTRGDNLRDSVDLINDEFYTIEKATRNIGGRFTLENARQALVDARRLLDDIDGDLCERNDDGSRKE
jgi:hypothetical protein